MIILRQREFGRTGLTKEQAKQFFKSGQGKANKAAKRLFELDKGKERFDIAVGNDHRKSSWRLATDKEKLGHARRPNGGLWFKERESGDTTSLGREKPTLKNRVRPTPINNPMEISKEDANMFSPAFMKKWGMTKQHDIDKAINKKAEAVGGRPTLDRTAIYEGKPVSKSKILRDKSARTIYDHGKIEGGKKVGYKLPKPNKEEFKPTVEPVERPRIEGRRRGIM